MLPERRLTAEAVLLQGQGDVPGALKKLEEAERIILIQVKPQHQKSRLKLVQRLRAEVLNQIAPKHTERLDHN